MAQKIQVVLEFVDDELMDAEQFETYIASLVGLVARHSCFAGYKIKTTQKKGRR